MLYWAERSGADYTLVSKSKSGFDERKRIVHLTASGLDPSTTLRVTK